ncbi:MAG: phosphoribosyltransferase family protein [bacterium]|nr:phosphoribosyltransferase family protein [bacterium]
MAKEAVERGIFDVLKDTGAVITDSHFVYTSGKHGSVYVNKDAVYPHTKEASRIGELFAERVKDLDIDVVVGPALGGIILSQWTAYHLSELKRKEILGVYTEKDANENQIFRRGYDRLVQEKNVLVVEDLTTTGGSVKKVVDSVRHAGGTVVAVGVMVNRDPENINEDTIGAPFFALGILRAEAFDEKDCHLCKDRVPINTSVGHGRKYLEEKRRS